MKKKFISLLTAAMLVASMGTTVFAAGSPSAGDVTKPDPDKSQTVQVEKVENVKTPEEYVTPEIKDNTKATVTDKATGKVEEASITVAPVGKTTVDVTAQETVNQLANIDKIADDIKNGEQITAVSKDPTKKVVPEIQTVVNVQADDVEVTTDKPITLSFPVAGVKAGDAIMILHFTGEKWETIAPDAVEDGKVTATFTSLSPIAIVKLTVAEADPTPAPEPTPNPTPAPTPGQQGGSGSNGSAAGTTTNTTVNKTTTTTNTTATTATTTTTKTSPKTGWSLL